MPELPEVETVASSLRAKVLGRTISALWTSGAPLRRPVDARALRRATSGSRIDAIDRRGKYLLLRLSGGHALVCHLGMTGRLLFEDAAVPRAEHTHVVFRLEGGKDELRYIDPRRFGHLAAVRQGDLLASPELAVLGVDPLTEAFTPEALLTSLRSSRRAIKDFLLDQGRVAGLGNIYAAEALFAAGISPRRRADHLGAERAARLHASIVSVLEAAIARRGTTFSDYVDADGRAGGNQHHLTVYQRAGQPCRQCARPIRRLVQGARSTFFCPGCQR